MFNSRARVPADAHSLDYIKTLFHHFWSKRSPAKFPPILHVLFQFAGVFIQRPDIGSVLNFDAIVVCDFNEGFN